MTDIAADDLVGDSAIMIYKRKLWFFLVLGVWSFVAAGDFSPRLEKPPEPKCPTAVWGVFHWGEACWGGEVVPGRLAK
jgi:hypothetical protein